jgi:hypothetical protein
VTALESVLPVLCASTSFQGPAAPNYCREERAARARLNFNTGRAKIVPVSTVPRSTNHHILDSGPFLPAVHLISLGQLPLCKYQSTGAH